MREQREQSHLANVSALARHIRPGDERDLGISGKGILPVCFSWRTNGQDARATTQHCVIRHKAFINQLLLQHRMSSVANEQHAFVADLRTTVIVEARGFGKTRQHIQLCERGGGLLNPSHLPEHFLAHALEQFVFQLHAAFFRPQNFSLHLLQLGRDVTFTIGDGLLANVMRRDFVEVRLRDFDVVAEDGVEPHLQRRDARA